MILLLALSASILVSLFLAQLINAGPAVTFDHTREDDIIRILDAEVEGQT
jgi:hypothetical protein